MNKLPLALTGSALCVLLGLAVAWQKQPVPVPTKPVPMPSLPQMPPDTSAPVPGLSDEQLKELHANELGRVPILEYHEIGPNPPGANRATRMMHRSIDDFRDDLQRLYSENYVPINLSEYLDNKIDLPAGKSPVILTFDDARSTQFRYRSDHSIDPDCAVGILQDFAQQHPDFPLKGTFYVLPEGAFGSDRYAAKKMRELVKMGFELGNHTLNHHYFNRMSDAAIAKEIALGKAVTEKMVPGVHLDTLALPGGCKPRSHNYGVLTSGVHDGIHYTNRAVIDAWGGSAPASASTRFDRLRIPRVLGVNGSNGVFSTLDYLQARPGERYISDGDPNTLAVPQRMAKLVNKAMLGNQQLHLYNDGLMGDNQTKSTPHKRRTKRRHTSSKGKTQVRKAKT